MLQYSSKKSASGSSTTSFSVNVSKKSVDTLQRSGGAGRLNPLVIEEGTVPTEGDEDYEDASDYKPNGDPVTIL